MRGGDVGLKAVYFMVRERPIENERVDEDDGEEGLENTKLRTGNWC